MSLDRLFFSEPRPVEELRERSAYDKLLETLIEVSKMA